MTKTQIPDFKLYHEMYPDFSMEQINYFHQLIDSFIKLFGEYEYINFHNDFMHPLMMRTFLKDKEGNKTQ